MQPQEFYVAFSNVRLLYGRNFRGVKFINERSFYVLSEFVIADVMNIYFSQEFIILNYIKIHFIGNYFYGW